MLFLLAIEEQTDLSKADSIFWLKLLWSSCEFQSEAGPHKVSGPLIVGTSNFKDNFDHWIDLYIVSSA